MKPFQTIAIPYPTIVTGRMTMDAFATDLWGVSQGRGSQLYASRKEFFENTYQSEGLKQVLSNADLRLQGGGGDPVIQLQAPFGAGKTHALIALYHYVNTMDVKQAVVVGTALTASETLWGLLEKQLTGEIVRFSGLTSPGREAVRELLTAHQPVNILIDKVSEYVTKAAAIAVGESTLAAQTLLFFQELSEAVSALDRAMLVFTLPSEASIPYDDQVRWFCKHIQKITGRVERIQTMLQDYEVAPLLRHRLFEKVKENAVQKAVNEFLEYARQENLLPAGSDLEGYRRRFEASYPFLPEMLDILYHRWGQYPTFQRVRGMLRILTLVLRKCHQQALPYLTAADIDLDDPDIRYELLRHAGSGGEKIVVEDITGESAGVKRVEAGVAEEAITASLPKRAATTIFVYSFPHETYRGLSFGELKRHALFPGISANVLVNVVAGLKERLLYLQHERDRFSFSPRMTLNRLLLNKLEAIEEGALEEFEQEMMHKEFPGERFQIFVGEQAHANIPDRADLKLVVLRERDEERLSQILLKHGDLLRIHRNTLFFLVPLAEERGQFLALLRQFLALGMLLADSSEEFSDDHRKEVRSRWRNMEFDVAMALRRSYRLLLVPGKDQLEARSLPSTPATGYRKLEEQVYAFLRAAGDIVERVAPLMIRDTYLREKPFVFTEQLMRFNGTTLGEPRVAHRSGWEEGIRLGVQEGLFGLGILKQRKPICICFRQTPAYVRLSGNEILIRQDLSEAQQQQSEDAAQPTDKAVQPNEDAVQEHKAVSQPEEVGVTERFEAKRRHPSSIPPAPGTPFITSAVLAPRPAPHTQAGSRNAIHLRFDVPQGNVTDLMSIIYSLRPKFQKITLEIHAEHGDMTAHEYQMNVQEILRNMGISVESAEISSRVPQAE